MPWAAIDMHFKVGVPIDFDIDHDQGKRTGDGPRFGLIVHHTDAEREWAYDPKSHIGALDNALDEAKTRGWTVASMKDDWKTIHPPQP